MNKSLPFSITRWWINHLFLLTFLSLLFSILIHILMIFACLGFKDRKWVVIGDLMAKNIVENIQQFYTIKWFLSGKLDPQGKGVDIWSLKQHTDIQNLKLLLKMGYNGTLYVIEFLWSKSFKILTLAVG